MKAVITVPPSHRGPRGIGTACGSGGQVISLHGWAITGLGGGPDGGKLEEYLDLSWVARPVKDCVPQSPHPQEEVTIIPFPRDWQSETKSSGFRSGIYWFPPKSTYVMCGSEPNSY